jgi:hypothetical protein
MSDDQKRREEEARKAQEAREAAARQAAADAARGVPSAPIFAPRTKR